LTWCEEFHETGRINREEENKEGRSARTNPEILTGLRPAVQSALRTMFKRLIRYLSRMFLAYLYTPEGFRLTGRLFVVPEELGRANSEILLLVGFQADTVRLDAGTTKNREGRFFPMTLELKALLMEEKAKNAALQRALGAVSPWVFTYDGRPSRASGGPG
jgi:hypothetical protein